jgi:hypothetical protein
LDNLHADFYDGEGDGDHGGDGGLVVDDNYSVRGGRMTGIYNENTGNIIPIDGDDDSDDDNDLYFWEDYEGERGENGDDGEEVDDNMDMRELERVG